jgi:hypothetical protein
LAEEQTATLRVGEAVELAHALLTRLSEIEGVRILFIKGPTAVLMGARPPRPSSDVDVLCEPGGMEKIGAALERCGWRRRVPESAKPQFVYAAKYLFEHSVHYIHDKWPCDLDIHYNFPGFFAPDDVVFDALWERHATVEVAHWPVPCADFLGQACIVGLHALRDPDKPQSQADLDHLAEALNGKDDQTRRALSSLASATGCTDALRPLLEQVGAEVATGPWSETRQLNRWSARTSQGAIPTVPWLLELRERPWRSRPALIWHAFLLPRDQLFTSHVGLEPSTINIARLQLRRWRRGLRNLPRGIAATRQREWSHRDRRP